MATAVVNTLTPEDLRHVSGRKWSDYPDCIGAWVAEMDFGTSPEVKHALREMVDSGFFGYTPQADVDRLKTSVATWYKDTTGWEIPVDRIRPLPDVIQGLVGTLLGGHGGGTRHLYTFSSYRLAIVYNSQPVG